MGTGMWVWRFTPCTSQCQFAIVSIHERAKCAGHAWPVGVTCQGQPKSWQLLGKALLRMCVRVLAANCLNSRLAGRHVAITASRTCTADPR